MKILYHHRIASKDGQYVHIEEIVNQLLEQGQELTMVCPKLTEKSEFGSSGGLVAALKRHVPGALYEMLELLYNLVIFIKLLRAITKNKPDVIYERYNLFTVAGIWVSKLFKVPLILEINAPLFEERSRFSGIKLRALANWSEGYCWRNATHTLPVTEVLADHVKARGVEASKISIIANGVDTAKFNPDIQPTALPASATGKTIIGFVGFCREWHELDKVVELIAPLQQSHLFLLIIGDGPARESIEKKAQQLGVTDRVYITGIVNRDEMPAWQAAIDIALQPAVVAYASPLKMLEYMACGKAIVAPAQDNIKELLQHEQNALLFEQGDTESFLGAIQRLADSEQLRRQLGGNAVASIEQHRRTWAGNAHTIIELIKHIQPDLANNTHCNEQP